MLQVHSSFFFRMASRCDVLNLKCNGDSMSMEKDKVILRWARAFSRILTFSLIISHREFSRPHRSQTRRLTSVWHFSKWSLNRAFTHLRHLVGFTVGAGRGSLFSLFFPAKRRISSSLMSPSPPCYARLLKEHPLVARVITLRPYGV